MKPIFQIESFVFNEENDDEDEDESNLNFNSKFTTTKSNNTNNTNSNNNNNLAPTIDADTRIKLEALLANAGINFHV